MSRGRTGRDRRQRAKRVQERIPNHVLANLEDLLAIIVGELQPLTRSMLRRIEAERQVALDEFDQRRAAALGEVALLLAQYLEAQQRAERKVRDAKAGEYVEYTSDPGEGGEESE